MSDNTLDTVSGETPETSPVEPTTPEGSEPVLDASETSSTPAVEIPPEAKEWATLSGSTQERIRELLRERNEALEKVKTVPSSHYTEHVPAQEQAASTDEVKKAVKVLKDNGVATMDDVNAILARIQTDRTHESLSSKYNGQDGLPKYDKEEVEDYARKKSIWDLEAAFQSMYFDEFMDHAKSATKRKVYTEKPSSTTPDRKEPVTLDSFRAKLRNPDGSLNMVEFEKLSKEPAKLDALLRDFANNA